MSLKLTPVLICLVTVKIILGQYTITKSKDYVVTGSSITFTCNTGSSVSGILWITSLNFPVSQESGTSCGGCQPQYQCSCSGGTVFNLTINNIDLSYDGTGWACGPAFGGTQSNTEIMIVVAPVNYTFTEVSGSRPNSLDITEGNSAIFTCVVQGAKPEPTVSQILWYVDSNKLPVSITGSPTTTDRLTTLSVTYTASREHDGQKVFCAAENDLMINQSIPAVNSSNKIELHILTVVCVCDCTVALCVLQAVWMVVVVVYLILCLTVLKDFKPRWIVLVVFGFIQIVLGLISVGCLSIENTCSSCKSDAYVAGAVFCALSLLCGTVVVIVVLLLKVIRKPSSGTLNVASEGKKRPPPEGQAETVMIKDEKKSPQSVPPTATTTVSSSRQLPPDSGNVAGDEGKKPRPLPAPSGNVSPTVTSASQIDTDVNNETQDDVMKTPGRLPPLEMTETETEKPKKKKKKKKSKKAEDLREKREDSEEGNDDNQRE